MSNNPVILKPVSTGISGEARCILYDENMKPVYDSGWNSNVITDVGLDYLFTEATPVAYTYIGSSAVAADVDDEVMGALLASTVVSGVGSNVLVDGIAPNYEFSRTLSRRFGAGIGTGNVNEVGMGANSDSSKLVCRQVLASTIVKGATQSLDVIWRWTIWPMLTDATGVVDIGGVAYNYITRSSLLGDTLSPIFPPAKGVFEGVKFSTSGANWSIWDGNIGVITGTPSGNYVSGFASPAATFSSYTPGAHWIDVTKTGGLADYILGAGIRSFTSTMTMAKYQTQFDAVVGGGRIPKTGSNEISLTWRFTWDRH